MRRSLPARDQLLMRLGAAKTDAGRAFGFVQVQIPAAGQPVTRESFRFSVDKTKLNDAELRDGHYLLRSNLTDADPAVLWTRYVQLTQIESVFRSLKSELGIRPIFHRLEHRVDAHILIAFLAYSLQVTLKHRLLIPSGQGPVSLQLLSSEHLSSSQRRREVLRVASYSRCDSPRVHPLGIRKRLRQREPSGVYHPSVE
jgi:hypothetical protein